MARFMPVTQVRLTNVAIVRLNTHGKRFEVAAYKNKVVNWRNGLETDLDEVLQTTAVFSSVSRGVFAKTQDLVDIFGSADQEQCCRLVLERGELQVSDKERAAALDAMTRDVASIVSEKCVNAESNRPYPVSAILAAMKEVHFAPKLGRSAKTQALDVIRRLKAVMPIERAKMRVRVRLPTTLCPLIISRLSADVAALSEREADEVTVEMGDVAEVSATHSAFDLLMDPAVLRIVNDALQEVAPAPQSSVDILQLACVTEGGALVDQELARRGAAPPAGPTAAASAPPAPPAAPDAASVDGSVATTTGEENGGRKGNRKSKGAKRREKEEAAERRARREAEDKRRAERQQRKLAEAEAEAKAEGVRSDAEEEPPNVTAPPPVAASPATNGRSLSCNTCGGEFADRGAHREHFRSDWHRYNLKRKMARLPPMDHEGFAALEDPFGSDAPPEPATR